MVESSNPHEDKHPRQSPEKGTVDHTRRNLLTGAAIAGVSATVGIVPGFMLGQATEVFRNASNQQPGPDDEMMAKRHEEFLASISRGNGEAVQAAMYIIKYYNDKLESEIAVSSQLQDILVHHASDEGTKGFQNTLSNSIKEQAILRDNIEVFKNAVQTYLDNQKVPITPNDIRGAGKKLTL